MKRTMNKFPAKGMNAQRDRLLNLSRALIRLPPLLSG